ncbi:MAG: nucleoside deaminase [Pseudomonadota bacterium]|nr:nucleoside deaminase [Pseudomonadota bacterium]
MLKESVDTRWMRRCFDLARDAASRKELPFGSVIARDDVEISAKGNGVREARDVTRHAEVCAIVAAQAKLGRASLEGCTLYTNMEPCAFCSYAIRETRIARVVFALASPVMGGASRWDVLHDDGLSKSLPEVFGPAPEVVAGYLAEEADAMLRHTAPMMWATSHARGLFICDDAGKQSRPGRRPDSYFDALKFGAMEMLRRRLFDRFSRGTA